MSWKEKSIIPILSKISPVLLGHRKNSDRVFILAYHRVLEKKSGFLFDEGVISVSPALFEKEIKFCKEYFSPISFGYLKECMEKKKPLPPNPLIVTFDDGYIDNYTNAFPVLQKFEVPATIFLTADYINTDQLFWWDEVSYYMKAQGKSEPDIKNLLRSLKLITDDKRIEAVEDIKKSNKGVSQFSERQALNWEEVKAMSRAGIEFGSHTMSHPVLSKVEDKHELEYEIRQSKKIIEEKIEKEVIVFSYPIGGGDSFSSDIKKEVKDAGYSFAVNYIHGVNIINNGFDRFSLKRLDMDQLSLDRFKAKLAFPGIFRR